MSAASKEEMVRRKKAVDFARGNIGLEGFKISPEQETLVQRYVNGEIKLAELLKPDPKTKDSCDGVAKITNS